MFYFKITYADLDMAQNFFDNEKHYGEFLVAISSYYRTQQVPNFKTKIVERYFKTYQKTADFILKQKNNGSKGGSQRVENQINKHKSLEAPLTEAFKPKVNISKESKINKENKENILPEVKKLRGECKDFFLSYYLKQKGEEYYWAVKDAANLIKLLSKVEFKVKEKNGVNYTNEEIYLGFCAILTNIKDNWILDNLSIPTINSRFNEIFSQIKNGTNAKQNTKGDSQFRTA